MRKKIVKRNLFEMKMQIIDDIWCRHVFRCWEMYPPSFFYRYSRGEQERIIEKDLNELKEILEKYKVANGLSVCESK